MKMAAVTKSRVFRNVAQRVNSLGIARCFSVSNAVMDDKPLVGFIGLGNMGNHMARNLLNKGYPLLVYDVNTDAVNGLKESGAKAASNPAEIADNTDRIVTMLPANEHVQTVYTGQNGVFSKVKKGSLLIDSSTIEPAVSQQMSATAEKSGAVFFDAPVSGGVNAAKQALLTFMVGGPESKFPQVEEILKNMGKSVVHCGAVGTGQAAKICNNMLLAISMIGTSETMNLGMKLGLDPKLLAKILNMSSGRCWSSDTYNPVPGVFENVPSSNNYNGGFGTALMKKDLGLANNAAKDTKSAIHLGEYAYNVYTKMTEKGYGGKDFSCIFQILQSMSGPEVDQKIKDFFEK